MRSTTATRGAREELVASAGTLKCPLRRKVVARVHRTGFYVLHARLAPTRIKQTYYKLCGCRLGAVRATTPWCERCLAKVMLEPVQVTGRRIPDSRGGNNCQNPLTERIKQRTG